MLAPDCSTEYPVATLESAMRCLTTYRRYTRGSSALALQTFLLIANRGPLSATNIAQALGRRPSSIASTLAIVCEGLGLATSVEHPADARVKLLGLTPKGTQVMATMQNALGKTL